MKDTTKAKLREKIKVKFFDLLVDMAELELEKRFPNGTVSSRTFDMDYFVEQFIDCLRAKWFP